METMTKKFVAYYRVSTQKQGQSGLGLEAQKHGIESYIDSIGADLLGSYTDVVSGKQGKRTGLKNALEKCKAEGATLIAFKLDRLLRSLSILVELRKSGVRFTALDCLNDDNMIINIKASFAEEELRKVSERTKTALRELKAKKGAVHHKNGTKYVLTPEMRANAGNTAREAADTNQTNIANRELAKLYAEKGMKPAQILAMFQKKGILTVQGKRFTQTVQIQRLLSKSER